MSRVPAESTAFAHRSSRIMVNVAAVYEHPDEAGCAVPRWFLATPRILWELRARESSRFVRPMRTLRKRRKAHNPGSEGAL